MKSQIYLFSIFLILILTERVFVESTRQNDDQEEEMYDEDEKMNVVDENGNNVNSDNDYGEDENKNNDNDNDEEKSTKIQDFLGTNLIEVDGIVKTCFSAEEVALLSVRKEFEYIIPKKLPKSLLDDSFIETLLKYFYVITEIILELTNDNTRIYVQKAFYDTIGGYLNYYVAPVTKLSFYAGTVKFRTAENIFKLLKECKNFLNTNGNGWRSPINNFDDFNLSIIEPLHLFENKKQKQYHQNESNENKNDHNNNNDDNSDNNDNYESEISPCIQLKLYDDNKSELNDDDDYDIIISLPKLISDDYETNILSNIWLPLKQKHIFNLKSSSSAYILIRYFVLVTKCYQFQKICQDKFNEKFKTWILENIEYHLYNDEILYPGLGAILRVKETLKYKKKFSYSHHQIGQNQDFRNYCISSNQDDDNNKNNKQSEYVKLNHQSNDLSSALTSEHDKEQNDHKNTFFSKLFGLYKKHNSSISSSSSSAAAVADENSNTTQLNLAIYDEDDDSNINLTRRKYITYAVILIMALLIFVLIVAVITKYMSDGNEIKKKKKSNNKNEKQKKDKTKCEFCKNIKSLFCCCYPCKKGDTSSQDEEFCLKKNSPAIMSSEKAEKKDSKHSIQKLLSLPSLPLPSRTQDTDIKSSSSKESSPEPRKITKCLPCTGRKFKRSIEGSEKTRKLIDAKNNLNKVNKEIKENKVKKDNKDDNVNKSNKKDKEIPYLSPKTNLKAITKKKFSISKKKKQLNIDLSKDDDNKSNTTTDTSPRKILSRKSHSIDTKEVTISSIPSSPISLKTNKSTRLKTSTSWETVESGTAK